MSRASVRRRRALQGSAILAEFQMEGTDVWKDLVALAAWAVGYQVRACLWHMLSSGSDIPWCCASIHLPSSN